MKCKNCGTELLADPDYCPSCGAKVIEERLTVAKLSTEFFHSFWSIDSNKPLLTFIDLFRKPSEVIGGYINGLRKKYINPYGYFTIALTLTGLYTFINLNYFPEYLEVGRLNANYGDQNITAEVTRKLMEHFSLITFLFIPVITLISRLVFLKNKKFNLAEHLIIHLYAYSHVQIITSILMLISFISITLFQGVNLFNLGLNVVYYAFVLKKLYEISYLKIIGKTLLFLLLIGIFFVVLSTVLALYIVRAGGKI